MDTPRKIWQKLFLFCLGLFIASAFCMKWMEPGFVQNGKLFTIIGLEISYPQEKIVAILSGLDEHVRSILRFNLVFDFVFMAGVYPGIAALCMMGRQKISSPALKKILLALAILQLVAWGCDIIENCFLLKWISDPPSVSSLGLYHFIVWTKWILALTGAIVAIPCALKRSNRLLKT